MTVTVERASERGAALVIALVTTQLLLALGAALVLLTSTETTIGANFRVAADGLYAADTALECAVADLAEEPDWNAVLSGSRRSTFVDGAPAGVRRLADGRTIDLVQVRNLAGCQKKTTCRDADLNASSTDRPWGTTNPRWNLYAYGRLADALSTEAPIQSPYYVVSMVADDPSESDNDPTRDGGTPDGTPSAGLGVLLVRAEAFGPRGAHRIVEATVARRAADGAPLRIVAWREVRH